jgi:multidrug efflux pump
MFSQFFIDRPVFATVLSVVILLVGGVALVGMPVGQYPDVTPPTIAVTASYPGAGAEVVAETVTTPIEQEINGVEGMLYLSSKSTGDGQSSIDVTFKLGTDIDKAQVLTQNRVAVALAKLPEEARRQGVTTRKKSPSILLCVNLFSPGERLDQLFISNFALLQVKDALARIEGVGDVQFLGARDYALRVWLDPAKLASRGLTATDVVRALREQNVQVAAGRIGQPPATLGLDFQVPVTAAGRLPDPAAFENVIVKASGPLPPGAPAVAAGRVGPGHDLATTGQAIVRLGDVGRAELGARSYDVGSRLDGQEGVTVALFQQPGSNALATAERIRHEMALLERGFPEGLEYAIHYDTTVFVEESVREVWKTLFEAVVLVFIVVLVFLQDWRATIIPMVAVPVSLVGTFAAMRLFGFSLNNLSLFGLVLAIGIVVDDAIVVVENVERWLSGGLTAREAARRAMAEVAGPVIAIALVLCSVFVPTAFITGISGEFYRQFALTIAASTVISAFNSLTLSPALCVLLFSSHHHGNGATPSAGSEPGSPATGGAGAKATRRDPLPPVGIALLAGLIAVWFLEARGLVAAGLATAPAPPWAAEWSVRLGLFALGALAGWWGAGAVNGILAAFFRLFNLFFDLTTGAYGAVVGRLLRMGIVVIALYVGLMALTYYGFTTVPVGFIPQQDKGYLLVTALLPPGASAERTAEVMADLEERVKAVPGVAHRISVSGYSLLANVNQPNAGGMFVLLEPFARRAVDPQRSAVAILRALRRSFVEIREAQVVAFGAPPIDGLGNAGGFKLQVLDRASAGPQRLEAAAAALVDAATAQPGLTGLFSGFRADEPKFFVDIDREKVKAQGIDLAEVNAALQVYLGSAYVNDWTAFGRNWPVLVQADRDFRMRREDISRLEVRNSAGEMVPLSTLVTVTDSSGPAVVNHFNLLPSADINGSTLPGTSSGDAIALMEALASPPPEGQGILPPGMEFAWTELSLQQILAGNTAGIVFALGTVFVFLVLAAQYESWSLPLAIILIVPMCLLAAIAGVWIAGLDNSIFTQIGLVVLVGLAAKNAILIVEFAKQQQDAGLPLSEAVLTAARMRLRPILMTSLAFILGVVPLVLGRGAGAEMRVALGTAVFSGMLGVTVFGIFFTPVFYSLIMGWGRERNLDRPGAQPVPSTRP